MDMMEEKTIEEEKGMKEGKEGEKGRKKGKKEKEKKEERKRVRPKREKERNGEWLGDKSRYGYDGRENNRRNGLV